MAGAFWGITTFFNVAGYKNKSENYRLFRANSRRQGLSLLTVELAFGDAPFELGENDADILVQLRGTEKNIMWQKEALLNVALKNLPVECDKVAWVDSDILFRNDDWIRETSLLLEKRKVLQLFSHIVYLSKGATDHGQEEVLPGFAFSFVGSRSFGYSVVGGAWACRKEIMAKHSFYTTLFSSDTATARVFSGTFRDKTWEERNFNDKALPSFFIWAEAMDRDIQANVGYVSGVILHLWHGDLKERIYHFRDKVFKLFDFDPGKDIRISSNGLLEWASDKPKLHQMIKEYFRFRNEEEKNVLTSFIVDELYTVKRATEEVRKEHTKGLQGLEWTRAEIQQTKKEVEQAKALETQQQRLMAAVPGLKEASTPVEPPVIRPKGPRCVKLFCYIYKHCDLLNHFFWHHDLLGINEYYFVVNIWGNEKIAKDVHARCKGRNVVLRFVNEPFVSRRKDEELESFKNKHACPDEWVMFTDLDEFVEFNVSLDTILFFHDLMGYDAVCGRFVDRIHRSGALPWLDPRRPIEEQFPLGADLTRNVLLAWDHKVVLMKACLKFENCAHTVEGKKWDGVMHGTLHHYKWKHQVLERLTERVESFRSRQMHWWRQSDRFLVLYSKKNRIDIQDPNLNVRKMVPVRRNRFTDAVRLGVLVCRDIYKKALLAVLNQFIKFIGRRIPR